VLNEHCAAQDLESGQRRLGQEPIIERLLSPNEYVQRQVLRDVDVVSKGQHPLIGDVSKVPVCTAGFTGQVEPLHARRGDRLGTKDGRGNVNVNHQISNSWP
jgi:hypothetical protein